MNPYCKLVSHSHSRTWYKKINCKKWDNVLTHKRNYILWDTIDQNPQYSYNPSSLRPYGLWNFIQKYYKMYTEVFSLHSLLIEIWNPYTVFFLSFYREGSKILEEEAYEAQLMTQLEQNGGKHSRPLYEWLTVNDCTRQLVHEINVGR